MGGYGRRLQPHGGELVPRRFQHFLPVVRVLVDDARRRGALFLDEVTGAGARLVIVDTAPDELQLVKGLHHRARARNGEQVGRALFKDRGHERIVHGRSHGEYQREDAIAMDQLVGRLDRAWHLVLRVLDNETDFSAVDATLGIDFIESHPGAVDGGHAEQGNGAGQVVGAADENLLGGDTRFRDTALCGWRGGIF